MSIAGNPQEPRTNSPPPSNASAKRSGATLALILLISVVNGVIWLFMSLLAVGGDGSTDAVYKLWLIGFPIIAAVTVGAILLRNRRRNALALLAACSPLPLAYCAILSGIVITGAVQKSSANVPEMTARCQRAGAHYDALPAAPVRSLAYDWERNTYAPPYNFIRMDARGNMQRTEGGTGRQRFPQQIEFIESRCCRYSGRALTGEGDFIRRANDGSTEFVAVPELTADALIYFTSSEIPVSGREAALIETEIVATDRRDGRKLATLRYVVDQQAKRICGLTSPGVLDERQFVMRALGLAGE